MKILLVDDDTFMLGLLARQLANLGIDDVVCCEDGEDALATLEGGAGEVELIFCDLQMPGMDGVEFVRHLVQRVGYRGGLVLVSGEDQRILQTAQKVAEAHRLDIRGVLRKPVSSHELQHLLNRADLAGESATASPRKCDTGYTADELRQALQDGQLVNYYQPKIDLANAAVAGVETLVRWQHPRDGLVFPDQFVPLAENCGLIDELTRCVLSGALGQARRWLDDGLRLHVAVNVSMANLVGVDFPDLVAGAAAGSGVPPTSLILEVTESCLMKDPLAALEILTRLRLKRIGLSIDDFGTGHSSLAQLRDIPFDELKLDRGFVHGASRDPALKAIVEASCSMARQLGLRIVAEGVEDRDDWNFVRAAGCDLAQGYLIARPMPAAALTDWIASWKARRCEFCGAGA